MGRILRCLALLAAVMATAGLSAQGIFSVLPEPRHAVFNGYPTSPKVDTKQAETLQDTMRDGPPISTGHLYYTNTAGNPRGPETTQAKGEAMAGLLDYMRKGTSSVTDAMSDLTGYGSAGITAISEAIQDIQAQLLMPVEAMEYFQKGLQAYQLYRRFEVMKKAWTGPLFKIDLLDMLPTWEPTETDQFGVPTQRIRVGLTYKSTDGASTILSRSGMDNPFIGSWETPKFRYQGPHKLDDIGLNIAASPYMTADQNAIIQIGTAVNEVLDRTWFEGVMGRSMARDGLIYSYLEDGRPSPKLGAQRLQKAADARLDQIAQEMKEAARSYKNDPEHLKQVLDALDWEADYWRTLPDGVSQNQAKRISRLRNELVTTNNETAKLESKEFQSNHALPDTGNGFFDSVFNTYKTIGDLTGELVNDGSVTDKDGTGDPGELIVHKANVQYAKSTHGAYAEAQAIRKIVYSRLKAECQQRMADGFNILAKQVARASAETAWAEVNVARYQQRTNTLLQKLQERGMTPVQLSDLVYEARRRR